MKKPLIIACLMGAACTGLIPDCYAALGGLPSLTAQASQNTGRVVRQAYAAVSSTPYTTVSSVLGSGTTATEYVTQAGTVFAVAWSGPYQPDLRSLLGEQHFGTLVDAASRRGAGNRSLMQVNNPDLIISVSGHMRAFTGRAWIPSALPAGFDPADIR